MQAEHEASAACVSLRIRNSRATSLTFYLEPWGEAYSMPPDAIFEVVARGPEGDCLEIEYTDEHITVYGWSGSTVSLFHTGMALGADCEVQASVPTVPPGEKS